MAATSRSRLIRSRCSCLAFRVVLDPIVLGHLAHERADRRAEALLNLLGIGGRVLENVVKKRRCDYPLVESRLIEELRDGQGLVDVGIALATLAVVGPEGERVGLAQKA